MMDVTVLQNALNTLEAEEPDQSVLGSLILEAIENLRSIIERVLALGVCVMRNIDNLPLSFGQHKGETPDQIASIDPGYIVWLYEKDHTLCTRRLYRSCKHELEDSGDEMSMLNHIDNYGDR